MIDTMTPRPFAVASRTAAAFKRWLLLACLCVGVIK